MPITIDRWNIEGNADRNCKKCDKNEIGDENHYVFSCNFFSVERAKYLTNFVQGTDDLPAAWETILSYNDTKLVDVAKFISHIISNFEFVDKIDKTDFDNDWHKVKQAKITRSGRIVKSNTRYA